MGHVKLTRVRVGKPSRASTEPVVVPHHRQCCQSHEAQQQGLVELMPRQEKLNEAVMMLNKNLQEINIQNMDTELVAQMFKNYQSNVLFHLEGMFEGMFANKRMAKRR
jgi:DASH complex subunit DAD4